jgi:hypothetical protein
LWEDVSFTGGGSSDLSGVMVALLFGRARIKVGAFLNENIDINRPVFTRASRE